MFSNIWLSVWSSDYDTPANNTHKHTQEFYLGIYGALGFGQGKMFEKCVLSNLFLKKSKNHLFQ